MSKKWNFEKSDHVEEMLSYYFSLPDDDSDSEAECDPYADQELDNTQFSNRINPTSEIQEDFDLPEPPVTEDIYDVDENNETIWGENISNFQKNIDRDLVREYATLQTTYEIAPKEEDFFQECFVNIIPTIVSETNKYARQKNTNNWIDVDEADIKAFIGLQIIMGIHQLPHLKNYWSSDPILGVPAVSNVISAKRFKKIVENIHLNDNQSNKDRTDPDYDKLHKVRPVIEQLNLNFKKNIKSSSYLSVDEAMIKFKGRTSLKQYMPMKPVKRGYKAWCLADSTTGYILKFDIYTGKTTPNQSKSEFGLGERIVIKLTEGVQNQMNIVAFDNFFTSVKLLNYLHSKGIAAVGTVRTNKKGLPEILKNGVALRKGEFQYKTKGPIVAVRWMDNKVVNFLSSVNTHMNTTVVSRKNKQGKKEDVSCPILVAEYNRIMGGVDRFDQLRERYEVGRRSVKWWHRIMYFFIDIAVVNSFLLFCIKNRKGKPRDQLSFRISLARQLIGSYCSRKRRGRPAAFLAKSRTIPEDVRLAGVGQHLVPTHSRWYL
jgi:hypothetical protein